MKSSLFITGIGLLIVPALVSSSELVRESQKAPVSIAVDCESVQGLEQIICLANAFKATLGPDQVTTLQRAYSRADAAKWSNFPEFSERPRRVGIRLGSLSEPQLKAAKALLAAVMNRSVPNEGFNELEGNLAADAYLGNLIGKTSTFNAGNYYLAFLGMPSSTGRWELQFGGHHFALANTYDAGKLTGVTPSFRGVEPIAPITVNGHTYQSMEQERQSFAELLGSLTSEQQATARLSATFRDILLGPGADGQFPTVKQGMNVGNLNAAQKKLVLNAIRRYVEDLDPKTVASVMASYNTDLDDTYIAYSGSGTMSQGGDYVRIDGPRVWIEYSGQTSRDIPGTVHPHSVWRDRLTDYGGK
jgi:hypothetical protein